MKLEYNKREAVLLGTLLDLFIKECKNDLTKINSIDIREFISSNKELAEGLKNKIEKTY